MWDEVQRLRTDLHLAQLLNHYATIGATDREAWQDRLMALADLPSRELVRLHGELVAHGWIEQNTGAVPIVRIGAAPQCYRITPRGRKALIHAARGGSIEEDGAAA